MSLIQVPPLGSDQASRLRRWAGEVKQFHVACTAALVAAYEHPMADSLIGRLRLLIDPMADDALGAARLRLDAGADHLIAIATLMETNPPPRLALFSLMRTVLETAAIAAWLLEPNLSPADRAERGRKARANNLEEVFKLTGSAETKARLAVISTPRLPAVIDLLKKLLPSIQRGSGKTLGEVLYRQLGGRAHGELWSSVAGQVVAQGVTTSAVAFSLDVEALAGALGPTLEVFEGAVRRGLELAGNQNDRAFADLSRPRLD